LRNSKEGSMANPGNTSEEKLKLLEFSIDNISDAVYWVTLDGRFWNVNAAACRMLGYGREELLSMSVHDIDPTYDPAEAQSDLEKVKRTGSLRLERFHNTRDGRVIPVEITSNYFTYNNVEYVCAIARDISERVKAEKEAAFFKTLIESTRVPVYVLDPEDGFRMFYANQASCSHYGTTLEKMLNMRIPDWDPVFDMENIDEFMGEFRQGKPMHFETVHHDASGKLIPVEVTCSSLVSDGKELIAGYFCDITERKRIEEELRFTQYAIDKTIDQAFWMTKDARLFYVNDAACRALGYTREELTNMSIPDIDPTHPPEVFAGHWRDLQENGSVTMETLHRAKDGRVYPVEIRANYVVFDGKEYNCAFVTDITDRKRAEESLQESEQKFRVLAETTPAAIIVYQKNKNVYVNPHATRLIGYTEREFLEMRFWDWAHPDFKELIRYRGLARQRGEEVPSQYEFKGVTKSGEEKWVFLSAGRIEYKSAPAGIVSIFDITDRKRIEDDLQRAHNELEKRVEERTAELEILNGTLEKRVDEEVAKNREKDVILIQQNRQAALGEMLDHIAHQWKQPLNTISLIVQDLEETGYQGELTEDYISETVGKILVLLDHMAQTINVFRGFYRPDKEKKVFSIKESIDQALAFIAPALRFHSIAIELDVDFGLTAFGYPKEYAQVLLNILANARDIFRARGTEKPRLIIRAFAEDNKTVVTITDNGGGIPEAIIGRIFEFYFTTNEASGGTGIGLYMSKNIIEKNMGGRLSAGNTGNGAQFRIELHMSEN
jgi:PAS domain S-box-containing protein